MNWSDVITILVVVFALMLVCGLLSCAIGRRFCRPGTWGDRNPTTRGFGCCCGRPDHPDRRVSESTPPHKAGEQMTGNGR